MSVSERWHQVFLHTAHNGFVVISAARADTDYHPDLALPFKMVLEEMRQLGVSVGDKLNRARDPMQ